MTHSVDDLVALNLQLSKQLQIANQEIASQKNEMEGRLAQLLADNIEKTELAKKTLGSLKEFRFIIENSPIAIRIASKSTGKMLFANRSFCELANESLIKAIGDDPRRFYVNAEDYDSTMESLRQGQSVTNKLIQVNNGQDANWGLASYLEMEFEGQAAYIAWFFNISDRKLLEEGLRQEANNDVIVANSKAQQSELQLLSSLNALAMTRDNETGNHIIRTQNYVKKIALRLREMGHYQKELSDQTIDLLFKAAPLHDIGKVGIPDSILYKQGRLNDEEWQIMKNHTSVGEAVLSSVQHEFHGHEGVIKTAFKIAGGHHEKWDGTGYPRSLKGNDIPLSARIMALADVYDALVSERVYKAEWSHEDAVNEIASKRGSHFDPRVVDAFLEEQVAFEALANQYRDS